jgi:Tfp pilus assembly protein FimT
MPRSNNIFSNIKRRKNQQGFSYIELLVSIGIIAMVSGLMMANYRYGQNRSEVRMSALKIANDIRLVQNHALSLKKVGTANPGGWGIYFKKNQPEYKIFSEAQTGGQVNKTYKNGEQQGPTIALPSHIGYQSLKIDTTNKNDVSIFFVPPDPVTYVEAITPGKAYITIEDTRSHNTSTISINSLGLIEVDTN